ncbi:hypothetical protein [Streptomyces sp. NPDC020983]|uniref:hypothetical protein n=1 Tax=Streptomyces sp. NPDC020983 TaxID=3365106 RepID=UPI0037B5F6A3
MTHVPFFGGRLAQLLDHRRLPAGELAARGGPHPDALRPVLAGAPPAGDLLRQLAPALGLHAADLFAAADLALPADLAPPHPDAERHVAVVVADVLRLPPAGQRQLLTRIRALPDEEPGAPSVRPPGAALRDLPGGRVVRMLRHRNLGWTGIARILARSTPSYLSAATYGAIGSGRADLTPRLVADAGTVLGVEAHELALLTGGPLPEPARASPAAGNAAALLWAARRLSAAQLECLEHQLRGQRPHGGER